MIVGVPRETFPGERRVAMVPLVIPTLAKGGLEVHVEAGAGVDAGYPDAEYAAKGAKIIADRRELFAQADVLVQVLCYGSNDKTGQADVPVAIEAIKSGAVDFIEKPYDAEVLLGAVRFALGGQANGARDAQRAEIQQKLENLSPMNDKFWGLSWMAAPMARSRMILA